MASNLPAAKPVWVVEDNPDHALLISLQLEAVPTVSTVTVIADGEQALRCIEGWPGQAASELPGLVLLDLQLPKVGGADVLRALRASAPWREVLVVVLSTSMAPSDIEACYRNGANAYLTKALHLSSLAERVSALAARWPVRE